jgi:predicted transposase YbfD/YdcC
VLVRVQREVTRADGVVLRSEDRYFISNESAGRFTPEQWLGVIRSHWRVENDAHKTLDVVLGEDDHPWIRDPRGMLVLQVLRRIACNALGLLRFISLKEKTARRTAKLIEWSQLLGDLRRALLAALEPHLEGLRWGPELNVTRA